MVTIYMMDIRPLEQEKDFWRCFFSVSRQRQQQAERYSFPLDRHRSLAAAVLIETGFYERYTGNICFNPEEFLHPELIFGIHGKPFFKEYPQICFNVSHAGHFAVAAFSEDDVGIDIEKTGRLQMRVASRFFTDAEQDWICNQNGEQDRAFTRIWTRKESLIKAIGHGLSYGLQHAQTCAWTGRNSSSTLLEQCMVNLSGRDSYLYFHEYSYENFCICVCSAEEECEGEFRFVRI